MAHTRQDTLVKPSEWAKHLRPFGKRYHNSKERRAAKKLVASESLKDNDLTGK